MNATSAHRKRRCAAAEAPIRLSWLLRSKRTVSPADNEVDGFKLGREYIAVFGRAHYFDVFGNAHWTQYCLPIGQNGFLEDEACTNFSEEGDGDYNRQ